MNDLSIILKADEKDVQDYVEVLKPLFLNFNPELIIINNEKEDFNIPHKYCVYQYTEDYYNFKEFCFASSLGQRIIIIEKGLKLFPELINSVIKELKNNNYLNISFNLKTYLNDEKALFFTREEIFVYHRGVKGFNNNIGITVEDLSLIDNSINIETNIKKLIQVKEFNHLYLWHENLILKMPSSFQLVFYTLLEKSKLFLEGKDVIELEDVFLHTKAKNQYVNYLILKKLFRDNIEDPKIATDIKHIELTEKEIYYCWLLKDFIVAKVSPNFIMRFSEKVRKVLINYLLENDNKAPLYIYNLIMNKNKDIEVNIDDEFKGYLFIIKTYIDFMKNKSEEPFMKERLLKVFDLYVKYSDLYFNNYYTEKNTAYYNDDEALFINRFNRVKELLTNKRIEESIKILKDISISYPEGMSILYYYIQKIRYENQLYPYVLSICMITKNEGENLDRCLSSLKPLIDLKLAEIIVVDTGSTDDTLEIAKQYTHNVFEYTWNDSFSEARNHSILFAQGEYIFVLDADEEFEKTEINKIISEFSKEDYKQYNTFTVRIKSFTNVELTQHGVLTQQRLFRNNGQFYYSSFIHNQPQCESPFKNLDIDILHYGYIMTEDIREKKFKRTTTLLRKMLQKDPRNIYYRYQLSSSYSMYGDLKEALKQVDILMGLIKENKIVKGVTLMYYNNAASIYLKGHRYDDADRVIDIALSIQPDFIDFIYYKAYVSFIKKNYQDALIYIERFLSISENFFQLDVANNAMYAFYTVGNKDNILGLYIISNYVLGRYNNCLKKVYAIEDKVSLTNCLHEVIGAYFNTSQYLDLAKLYKSRIAGNEKMESIFKYFVLENLFNCKPLESYKLLDTFISENIDEKLIDDLKIKIKSQDQHSESDSMDLISKYYMDGMDFKSAQKIFLRVVPLFKNLDIQDCTDTITIKKIKIVAQYILHCTENFIRSSLLTTEELMNIFEQYINLCIKLINIKEMQFLDMKERLFIKDIIAAYNKDTDHHRAIQYIHDAIMSYYEMESICNILIDSHFLNKEHNLNQKKNDKETEWLELTVNEVIQNATKINDDKEMRVLQGTIDLTDRTIKIAKALKDKGVYIKVLNYLPNYTNESSDYEMDIASFRTDKIKLANTKDIAIKLIPYFDIFHLHSFSSLTLDHSDLIVLKQLNKKMFMHFWGQDVRLYSKASKLNPYIKNESKNEDDEILNQLELFSKYIDHCIISDYELYEYVKDYFKNITQINLMIDLNQYRWIYENNEKRMFTIIHASSSPGLYGSKYILEAIDELKLQYNIDFKYIQEISPGRAIEEADLIIDQLLVGRYGQISIEAMALGKPVICWISDFMKEKYPKELPIIIANPDNIKEKLVYVLNNKDMLKDIGIQGRHYVEKYHNINTEVLKLIELYKV